MQGAALSKQTFLCSLSLAEPEGLASVEAASKRLNFS